MSATASQAPLIRVEHLGFTYAGRDAPTLRDISFTLEAGTWTLLAGRTGSGKSTLLRALAGLIPLHTAGRMTGSVCGDAPRQLLLQAADDQLCTTSVAAEVAFGLENQALPPGEIAARVAESLERFGLAGLEARPTHQLSGGQKQRLLLAAVLAMRPRVLLLDEPLGQLEPLAAVELLEQLERLRREGMCIVVAEHRLDELLMHVDRLLVLEGGRLVADVQAQPTWTAAMVNVADSLRESESNSRSEFATDQREFATDQREGAAAFHFSPATFRFPGAAAPLWQDVAFTLHDGDRVALVGPNGSGKSTLLNVMAGLQGGHPQGDVRKAGAVPVGLVMQNPDLMLFCGTVADELAFGPRQLGLSDGAVNARAAAAAEALAIGDLLAEPPQALSQGQRLRAAAAATLALAPQVLLLDEPTTGQDQGQVAAMLEALCGLVMHRGGPLEGVRALLFTTHDLRAVARFANRVLVLAEGRLLADYTPSALLHDGDLLRRARLRRPPHVKFHHRPSGRALSADELLAEVQR